MGNGKLPPSFCVSVGNTLIGGIQYDLSYMYSNELLDHFEHPRNSGELPDASAQARVQNPACGDILELAVKIAHGCIDDIRFRAQGCVPAMGCASAITVLAKGKSIADARAIDKADVIRAVGSLPPASGHAAQLAVDALRAVLKIN
jgi:nitrogen fixation NifU-like protein